MCDLHLGLYVLVLSVTLEKGQKGGELFVACSQWPWREPGPSGLLQGLETASPFASVKSR